MLNNLIHWDRVLFNLVTAAPQIDTASSNFVAAYGSKARHFEEAYRKHSWHKIRFVLLHNSHIL